MERVGFVYSGKVELFVTKQSKIICRQNISRSISAQPGVVKDLPEALQHTVYKLHLVTNENGNSIPLNTKELEVDITKEPWQVGFKQQNSAPTSCDLYSPPITKD